MQEGSKATGGAACDEYVRRLVEVVVADERLNPCAHDGTSGRRDG